MGAKTAGVEEREKQSQRKSGASEHGASVTEVSLGRATASKRIFFMLALASLAVTLLVAKAGSGPRWLIFAGVTLFLCAALTGTVESTVVAVTGDAEEGTLGLALDNGEEATIPRGVVAKARMVSGIAGNTRSGSRGNRRPSYGVVFDLHDGGHIDLRSFGTRKEVASKTAEQLGLLLEGIEVNQDQQDKLVEQAHQRLDASTRVTVKRENTTGNYRGTDAPDIAVSWSVARSFTFMLGIPLLLGALTSMVFGAIANSTSFRNTVIALGLFTLLGTAFYFRQLSGRLSVQIGADGTVIERTRGGSIIDKKELSLLAVQAIDAKWHGPLYLRLDEADESVERLRAASQTNDSKMSLPTILKSIWAMLRHRVALETGSLSLQERLDVELVLSAELAKRTGRSLAEI